MKQNFIWCTIYTSKLNKKYTWKETKKKNYYCDKRFSGPIQFTESIGFSMAEQSNLWHYRCIAIWVFEPNRKKIDFD